MDNKHRYIPIGLMLFALFFGAGNLIFPASMGQAAGSNVWWAVLGFCITGVGLPLVAVMAIGYSGSHGLQQVASRIHPYFALFYMVVCYLSIGPCFAVPRTGTVSYEIAVKPFLGPDADAFAQPIFLAIFFIISGVLAATPSKLVDRIGKILTPLLVFTITIFIIKSFITPMGEPGVPSEAYATPLKATVQGILDGYATLDAIAALIFATLVINAVMASGFSDKKTITLQVYKADFIAGPLLGIIYIFIAKIGAESVDTIGMQDTGAPVLALTSMYLFGEFGAMLLSAMVLLACFTTCIGLISCCASYFLELTGKMHYRAWVVVFTLISYLIGLFGLKTIIVSTIPVLMFIYPLCVALVVLIFLDKPIKRSRCVYSWTIALTLIMALANGLNTAGVDLGALDEMFNQYVPLYGLGLGWLSFAAAGFVIGLIHQGLIKKPA